MQHQLRLADATAFVLNQQQAMFTSPNPLVEQRAPHQLIVPHGLPQWNRLENQSSLAIWHMVAVIRQHIGLDSKS
jgi:hypothetical protein